MTFVSSNTVLSQFNEFHYKVAIIGAGNMGGAFYTAFSQFLPKEQLLLCDADANKLQQLGVNEVVTDPNVVIEQAEVILLAIKPQSFVDFCQSLTVNLTGKLLVSIMAGTRMATLFEKTNCKRIIRAMPNLGALASQSVTAWMASGEVSSEDKQFVSRLFASIGKEFEVLEENMIDKVTPLSGSGPAFFFYVCEMLYKKAVMWGFSESQAKIIAEQTLQGAAGFLSQSPMTAAEARAAVTSKGGVTEAALESLYGDGVQDAFLNAFEAGLQRSIHLQ